eukprot:c20204_g1_i7.p1 GENE.c20204_g1_i7~~c20204_g1_i7.p1  ORF type:complete len:505 (-),score=58.54 c20204_g1_i7:381-1862(-)
MSQSPYGTRSRSRTGRNPSGSPQPTGPPTSPPSPSTPHSRPGEAVSEPSTRGLPAKLMFKTENRRTNYGSPRRANPRAAQRGSPVRVDNSTRLNHALFKSKRWCVFEWLYAPVDLEWFNNDPFREHLEDLGLSQVTRLTRFEWAKVRWQMGRSRRFSRKFLEDEREKLNGFRKIVRYRQHHTPRDPMAPLPGDLNGLAENLPQITRVPNILRPGDRVNAIHPGMLFEAMVGTVLSYKYQTCEYRIKFDSFDKDEWVQDIYVMPRGHHKPSKRKSSPPRHLPSTMPPTVPVPYSPQLQSPLSTGHVGVSSRDQLPQPSPHLQAAVNHALLQQLEESLLTSPLRQLTKERPSQAPPPPQMSIGSCEALRPAECSALATMILVANHKQQVLQEIETMNKLAQTMQQSGIVYPQLFQEKYAQLVISLQEMNRTLRENHEFLNNQIQSPYRHQGLMPTSPASSVRRTTEMMPSYQLFIQGSKFSVETWIRSISSTNQP